MERKERTNRTYEKNKEFRKDRIDIFSEITKIYKWSPIPRIDVLIDKGTIEEGGLIANIERNWHTLFDEDELFNKELIETYLRFLKGSYLRYKNKDNNLFTLEYILLDTAIKKTIIEAQGIQDVTREKIFEGVSNLITGYRKDESLYYIEKILRRYNLASYNKEKEFMKLRKWFKNFDEEINKLFKEVAAKITELHEEKNNLECQTKEKQEIVEREEKVADQKLNNNLEMEELKERLLLFEQEYKRLNRKIEDLNRALIEQKKNTVTELINMLNEENFGFVLDRLYMWAFMNVEYDVNDIKLFIKNLFRAFEKLDIHVDDSNLLGIIDLKADEIGTKYRLNKDMGVYVPGYKKVIFPGWKYKDEYIINPMIEV